MLAELLASAVVGLALPPSWPDLEKRLPSSIAADPAIFDGATVRAADLAGKTVLFRDRNGWCPYAERAWLALELKRIDYATVLVDSNYSDTPCEPGSLPRVQWSDGTTHDGSQIIDILERLEVEQPQAPNLFPTVSTVTDIVRDSFGRFDALMPRYTKLSSLAPFVFVYKIQRTGKFMLEDALPGEIVPQDKYTVALEEIDELLGEYSYDENDTQREGEANRYGPFIAGATITAADIYWAPFVERLAAFVPLIYEKIPPLRGGEYENVREWLDAMDSQAVGYASRVKGRAFTWQERLTEAHPELDLLCSTAEECNVADLPTRKTFDAQATWAAYANGRAYAAATPAEEVAARIVRNRDALVDACASVGGDEALRELCAALADGGALSDAARKVAAHLDDDDLLAVPRDIGVIPAEALRQAWRS